MVVTLGIKSAYARDRFDRGCLNRRHKVTRNFATNSLSARDVI